MRAMHRIGSLVVLALPLACGPGITSSGSELTGTEASSGEPVPELPTTSETGTSETGTGESGTGETDTQTEPPPDGCEPGATMEGFVVVDTPEELAQLNGVCGIDGSLFVRDSAEITSLEPLSSLQWVTGQLVVADLPALDSLAGLSALRETTGLSLRGLSGLSDLSGLDAFEASAAVGLWDLPTLAGLDSLTIAHTFTTQATLRFSVAQIADLDSLDQLPELELIPGLAQFDNMIVDIESLPQLVDLVGVERVLSENPANVRLWLRNLPIVDLSGLEGHSELRGLALRSMPALTSFAGSEDLVELGQLTVSGAAALPSFVAFPSMEHIGRLELGSYCINESGGFDDNPLLVDLDGLDGVTAIDLLTVSGLSSFNSFAGLSPALELGAAEIRWNESLAPATIDAFLLEHALPIEQQSIDNCGNLDQMPCPPCPGD